MIYHLALDLPLHDPAKRLRWIRFLRDLAACLEREDDLDPEKLTACAALVFDGGGL